MGKHPNRHESLKLLDLSRTFDFARQRKVEPSSRRSFTRMLVDPSGSGRRGSLQLLDCCYSFTLRDKEMLGTSKRWIPQN